MIAQGAFPGTTQGASVANALYVKLGGLAGVASEREATRATDETMSLPDAMAQHYAGLVSLLNEFRDPRTPYVPRLFPQFESHGTPYDHLSRYREWSSGGTEEGA